MCNYPQWNKLKECNGKTFYPTWLEPTPEGKNPAPQHYFEYVLCNEKPLTQEETDFLKNLDQLDIPLRQQLIRQALEKTMQKTEIKKGYPLLQFVVEHICPDLARMSYQQTKPIKDRFTVGELASLAGTSYDNFYRKILPQLRRILQWYGWEYILEE